jgi:hypothetical protein
MGTVVSNISISADGVPAGHHQPEERCSTPGCSQAGADLVVGRHAGHPRDLRIPTDSLNRPRP